MPNHVMVFVKRFTSVLLLTLLLVPSGFADSPPRSEEEVKAAFIYNFLKYIRWPNEASFEAFRIGFIGDDDDYLDKLLLLQTQSIRNKAFAIHQVRDVNDIRNYHMVVVARDRNRDLANIARVLYGTQTLLITDAAKDKQLTMINFTYPKEGYVGFELNRYNLLYEKFEMSSDILLLGGTEIDIANVLREMEQELTENQDQLRQQNEKLRMVQEEVAQREQELDAQALELKDMQDRAAAKERELVSRNAKIAAQDAALATQTAELEKTRASLDSLRSELQSLESNLIASRERLESSTSLLEEKQREISEKESSIGRLSTLIDDNSALLESQKRQIQEQAAEIQSQEEALQDQVAALEGQRTTIQTQGTFLAVGGVGLAFIALVAVVLLWSNRARRAANRRLANANERLAESNQRLTDAQDQLVEAEKMAALGGLVAGVAHEINTPLGVSVTAASHLEHSIKDFQRQYESGSLRRSSLESLLSDAGESTAIMMRNLDRASELIGNFKQVAADQMVEESRHFEINEYLHEICQSIQPQLKPHGHKVEISGDEVTMHTYPGALAQVITNLVMNSLIHGFEGTRDGRINIRITLEGESVQLDYLDDGKGIPDLQISKVFTPFYTTKRAQGGTGLGMHISYNIITQSLGGKIVCLPCKDGAHFQMIIPIVFDRVLADNSELDIDPGLDEEKSASNG